MMELDFIPFTTLTQQERLALRADMKEVRFEPGQQIATQGDCKDQRVFILLEGIVEVLDEPYPGRSELVGRVEPGHYFGERSILFDEPRAHSVRVGRDPARCLVVEGERFVGLLDANPRFAQAMGSLLREKQKIFVAFDHFMATLLHGVTTGEIDFGALVERYKALKPALHPHLNDADVIDFDGLSYAIRRLPRNLTETFMWFLADDLPGIYRDPQRHFEAIETDGRRRTVYQMMPGKSIVLLRDGMSDLIDLLSCMCLYAVEARKLRLRLASPKILEGLLGCEGDDQDAAGKTLRALPITEEEAQGLEALWPGSALKRVRQMVLHHEDFKVCIWKRIGNYNSSHADVWTHQLAQATEKLMGCRPHALPTDLKVHIISSNTHSVTNCLSQWLTHQAEAIRQWGHDTQNPMMQDAWANPYDLAVALARGYLKAHPEQAQRRAQIDDHEGMLTLRETAFTGIQVQLFDTSKLAGRAMDPSLNAVPKERALLVNIDYAFGQQAGEIITNLIQLFGPNLASVNVLGKAGGLQGDRGDVLLPTAFLQQEDDLFQPLRGNSAQHQALEALLPDRGIHVGPVLTVAGTLLQNPTMLHFYRRVWRSVGLEMEGSYYHRPLQDALALGLVPESIQLRYLYYVSDLPLDTEANLSGAMRAIEGIPPLYAITRHVLNSIWQ